MVEPWEALRRLRPGDGTHRRVRGAADPALVADATPAPDSAGPAPHEAAPAPDEAVRPVASDVAASRAEAASALAALGVPAAAMDATTPGGRVLLPGLRLARAAAEAAALDTAGRARLGTCLSGASPVFAAYLLGTLATGRGVDLVETLSAAVGARRRDSNWLHRHLGVLDGAVGPATFDDDDGSHLRLRQFSPLMCGPAALIVLRVLADPAYALWLTTGAHVDADRPPDGLPFEHRFRTQQARVHDAIGRRALGPAPWPKFMGTPPWALARFVNRFTVLAGARFGWQAAVAGDPTRTAELLDTVLDALLAGVPVPLYLGRAGERHVVLAFSAATGPARLRVYDPAQGAVLDVPVADVADRGIAGWDQLEGVLVPLPRVP